MPELPEVETVRRGLEPYLTGRRLTRVEQRRRDLRFPFPEQFASRLTGRRITALKRRAKYLIAELDRGEALTVHLGMTGRFTVSVPGGANARMLGEYTYTPEADHKHDHVVFHVEGGATIVYNDARRFGYMDLIALDALAAHPHFRDIGIEPLGPELTPAFLAAAAHGRKADLKAFLMDQRIVCGLGNIYVCEALHRAGLSPLKPAARLSTRSGKPTPAATRLVPEIRAVLAAAIEAGGSTLRDHQQVDGTRGDFQHRFRVYDREGEACSAPGCAGIVRRRVQANRSSFYCPRCQR
jgi:formamidopyrimidine-DNA glycosylase